MNRDFMKCPECGDINGSETINCLCGSATCKNCGSTYPVSQDIIMVDINGKYEIYI
jgi:hypothetical protein